MIKGFYEFINEGKNYHLFKSVSDIFKILESGFIKNSGRFDSSLRKDVIGVNYGISVTRNFHTAVKLYGECVIEFDVPKLTDKYKVIPFSENPDYFLHYKDKYGIINSFKRMRKGKDKQDSKEFWKVKTDKSAMDFDIAEEIIVTNEIPIKYIKKLYFPYYTSNDILELAIERGIDFLVMDDIRDKTFIHTTDKYRELMKKREIVSRQFKEVTPKISD